MPGMGSVVGYSLIHSIAAGIGRAGAWTRKAGGRVRWRDVRHAVRSCGYRALDHQGTLGTFVGRTAVKDGKGVMVDWRYADGNAYLPADAEVKTLRPNAG